MVPAAPVLSELQKHSLLVSTAVSTRGAARDPHLAGQYTARGSDINTMFAAAKDVSEVVGLTRSGKSVNILAM